MRGVEFPSSSLLTEGFSSHTRAAFCPPLGRHPLICSSDFPLWVLGVAAHLEGSSGYWTRPHPQDKLPLGAVMAFFIHSWSLSANTVGPHQGTLCLQFCPPTAKKTSLMSRLITAVFSWTCVDMSRAAKNLSDLICTFSAEVEQGHAASCFSSCSRQESFSRSVQ